MIKRVYWAYGMHLFEIAMLRTRIILIFAMVAGLATPVFAQSNLEVPQTQSQNPVKIPYVTPTPQPQVQRGEGSTLQIAPAPTPTPPVPQQVAPAPQYQDPAVAAAAAAAAAFNALMNQRQPLPSPPPTVAAPPPPPVSPSFTAQSEPKLPQVFRGCWQGEVDMVDQLERLPGAHKLGYWTPKTYRLCYQRVGSGPFHLTFTEAGVVANDQVMNVRGHVDALATDGRAYARLRANLHFDEQHLDPGLRGTTFAVDEVTMLDCRISGDAMAVTAGVYGTRDGDPWFRARWRANFRHVPE